MANDVLGLLDDSASAARPSAGLFHGRGDRPGSCHPPCRPARSSDPVRHILRRHLGGTRLLFRVQAPAGGRRSVTRGSRAASLAGDLLARISGSQRRRRGTADAPRTGASDADVRCAAADGGIAEIRQLSGSAEHPRAHAGRNRRRRRSGETAELRRSWRRASPMRGWNCWPISGIARSGKRQRKSRI